MSAGSLAASAPSIAWTSTGSETSPDVSIALRATHPASRMTTSPSTVGVRTQDIREGSKNHRHSRCMRAHPGDRKQADSQNHHGQLPEADLTILAHDGIDATVGLCQCERGEFVSIHDDCHRSGWASVSAEHLQRKPGKREARVDDVCQSEILVMCDVLTATHHVARI